LASVEGAARPASAQGRCGATGRATPSTDANDLTIPRQAGVLSRGEKPHPTRSRSRRLRASAIEDTWL
jgi:hypothetical protein